MGLPAESDLFATRKAESVSELTRRIKSTLGERFPYVWVRGEISNFRPPSESGHLYFSLKDEEASLSCAMWRPNAMRLNFRPENGMEVIAGGRIDVYLPRGSYQLLVDQLEPLGAGALQIRFEQLKEKLRQEGLFDPARKRPLPRVPASVAIVTSPVGAALQDMLRTIRSRCPSLQVYLMPVRVQGDGAAEEIAAAVRELNRRRPDIDVMIVGRGGGSIEELWAFNEEVVARALAESRILTVSAVGHETDTTIADFAADVRALTPTDAATRVAPKIADLAEQVGEKHRILRRALESRVEQASQMIDQLRERMDASARSGLRARRDRLDGLRIPTPGELLRRRRQELDAAGDKARTLLRHLLRRTRESLEAAARHLDAVSPLKVLGRGYSITTREDGSLVRRAADVRPGERIHTRTAEGRVRSRVEDTEPD